MKLSVCLLTGDPPARIAALLEPVRPHADEIVLAADSRAGEDTIAAYRTLADTVFRVEFRTYERRLAWLFAQCRGEWILRLDGDEVPSAAFVARLPELLAARDVQQYWVSMDWLDPAGTAILDEVPWSTGFVNRLVRNDASLRVPGLQHAQADRVEPCAYLEEGVYHLDLAVSDEARRRAKVVRYDAARPGMVSQGGGRFNEAQYLPEIRGRPLATRPVPAEDRARLAAAITADAPVARDPGPVPFVSLEEMDRLWERRPVPESAYRATIELWERPPRARPDEHRFLFLRVRNDGTERWPWHVEHHPQIRLAYRWRDASGAELEGHGIRTAFPKAVGPGESVIAPIEVVVPSEPGRYELEIDVVHELVRWFDCPLRVPVEVAEPPDLPPEGPRVRETPLPPRRRLRRSRVPRRLHRAWLGDDPMPEELAAFGASFAEHHPGWELRLWTDADLRELGIGEFERRHARSASELSDVVRYEVLHRHGGVYVDTDVECLRPFDSLLERAPDGFAALEAPGRLGTAVLAARPGHPVFARAAREVRGTLGTGPDEAAAAGPAFLTHLVEQEGGLAVLGAHTFYPYLWNRDGPEDDLLTDTYAIHHWARSWWRQGAAR